MCTNFVPSRASVLNERFDIVAPDVAIRSEVYPGHLARIIRSPAVTENSKPECVAAIFGLIPSWSRDGKNYRFCYNARSETVAEKPSFRTAWRRNQFCVVPVDAFYEPSYESGRAVRWRIERADGEPMGLAAIWDAWQRSPAQNGTPRPGPADCDLLDSNWVVSFSLLTINADTHSVMNRFHAPNDEKRSVVMIAAEHQQAWLGGQNAHVRDFLHAMPEDELRALPDPKKPLKSKPPVPPTPTRKLF